MNPLLCSRRQDATVESAALLPLLAFLFVIALDYSRLVYHGGTFTQPASATALNRGGPTGNATDTAGIENDPAARGRDYLPSE